MTVLLDANVLIALVVADHVHHTPIGQWFAAAGEPFVTCPITQGSLLRFLLREGRSAAAARAVLDAVAEHPRHTFWADTVSYQAVPLERVVGHRQVTDAYLVQLATAHNGRLVTLDRGLATLYPRTVVLLSGS